MMMIQDTGYILQNTGFIMVMIYRMHSYIQKNELHDVQDALTVVVLALDAQCARRHCMVVPVCFMCMLDITVVQGVQLH